MTLLAIFEALVGANAIWETTVPQLPHEDDRLLTFMIFLNDYCRSDRFVSNGFERNLDFLTRLHSRIRSHCTEKVSSKHW